MSVNCELMLPPDASSQNWKCNGGLHEYQWRFSTVLPTTFSWFMVQINAFFHSQTSTFLAQVVLFGMLILQPYIKLHYTLIIPETPAPWKQQQLDVFLCSWPDISSLIGLDSPCFCGPAAKMVTLAFGPVPCSYPSHYTQQELLMCSAGRFITSEARWRCRFIMGRSSTVLFPQLMALPQTWGTAGGPQHAVYPMRNQQISGLRHKNTAHPSQISTLLGRLVTRMYLHYYRRQFYTAEPNKL